MVKAQRNGVMKHLHGRNLYIVPLISIRCSSETVRCCIHIMTYPDATEHPAVTRFREYLRIKTMQPTPDYAGSTAFLIRQAEEIGIPYHVVE
ncbi:adenylate cyclase, partial [Lobosporangium transversale]